VTAVPRIILGRARNTFIAEAKQWVAIFKDGRRVTVASHPYAFFVFLEMSIAEIDNIMAEACNGAGIANFECPPLPIVDIIKAGLLSNTLNWQALAIERAAEVKNIAEFADEYDYLIHNGLTQKIRHAALKLRAQTKRQ
jgi:hypothetical protein